MSAYIVFIRNQTFDQKELETYWSKVKATFEGHPIKVLAAYGAHEVLEGDPIEGIVVAEFPSRAAAKKWYDSPAYQEAREHRFKGAAYHGILVEGI
jgi:uncharacterized protein (DUF1330 family)